MKKAWPLLVLLGVASGAPAPAYAQAAACAPDALGTSRTLTLKREYAGYGKEQYGPLPLKKDEVVLTFDDGPNPDTLDRVLNTLAAQCVKATFFMTGANLDKSPELGRRVVAAGHTPALHSYAHAWMKEMPESGQLADLERGLQTFAGVFGHAPAAYRFPFLLEMPAILGGLKERGITVASVDLGIDDYAPNDQRTEVLAGRLAARLKEKGGGIVLMHDANPPTAEALPVLLKVIRDNGYKVVHLRWEDR
jgi:peptidoglycan-N-acetylglucosamine deacetylase